MYSNLFLEKFTYHHPPTVKRAIQPKDIIFVNNFSYISLYNFYWKVVGQFDSRKVRLLNRNHGLMVKSMEISENRMNICKYGTEQLRIDDAWSRCRNTAP